MKNFKWQETDEEKVPIAIRMAIGMFGITLTGYILEQNERRKLLESYDLKSKFANE